MAESLTVALTGATGFVGRHVLPQILARGHRVRALVRDPRRLRTSEPNVEPVPGELFDDRSLADLVRGCDAVVHLVGIIMEKPSEGQTFQRVHVESTRRLLAAAKSAGVKRWVHMSALGARPDAVSEYHKTKWTAEELVRASGLEWTIFRPSIIHGPDGEFMQMVKAFWVKTMPPFVPYFTSQTRVRDLIEMKKAGVNTVLPFWPFRPGNFRERQPFISDAPAGRLQPVYVEDVAACFAAALTLPRTVGETYLLGGPEAYTWPGLYDAVRRKLPEAKRKKIVAMPAWIAKLIASAPGAPFNNDQVIMSQEDSTCSPAKVEEAFGVKLAGFEETLAGYVTRIE